MFMEKLLQGPGPAAGAVTAPRQPRRWMRRDGAARAVPTMLSEKLETIIRQMNDEIVFYVTAPRSKRMHLVEFFSKDNKSYP
jgi:hypothetical protein